MNPHRPRKPRPAVPAITLLNEWREHVERTEQRVRDGDYGYRTGCECCDGNVLTDARDRLESMMRNGGRRARRLRVAVEELDRRFLLVTVEDPYSWRSQSWWRRRVPHG
ncbi:hypothetical protein AXK60_01890 [Tsukamurella pseudospumae]|uniref:Uncharacterized protein n=2 Tax=Tsukamurella TaxID=2060 RepID=A0A138AWB9_9ACTN|nr:hypothetical protein AXK61_06160 [Tsukamurella pseudospumae]KXP14666.1 hypothetical protein AXK60_01890 [Tsukamurella pseudospumae]